jgi:hypothetical protein
MEKSELKEVINEEGSGCQKQLFLLLAIIMFITMFFQFDQLTADLAFGALYLFGMVVMFLMSRD